MNFDYNLNLVKHLEDICLKASVKLNALASSAPNMTSSKNIF